MIPGRTTSLGLFVALAGVLAFGTISRAAIITYDVSSDVRLGGALDQQSILAPCPPCYFQTPFGAGSEVTVNTDTNGDGIADDASLVGGTLNVAGTWNLVPVLGDPLDGTLTFDTATTLTGGTGTIGRDPAGSLPPGTVSGEDILWFGRDTHASTTGTFGCTGTVCGYIGITEGAGYPISEWQAFLASQGVLAIDPFALGIWFISGGVIQASTPAVIGSNSDPPSPGAWSTAYQFGSRSVVVPEPGTFALVLLGVAGLALRSRRAG